MSANKDPLGTTLKVMLIEDTTSRLEWVSQSLKSASCEVVLCSGSLKLFETAVLEEAPDVVVIDMDSPAPHALEHVCLYCQVCPCPVVVFTDDSDTRKLRQAVKAGVAAYVVAGLTSERVRPILEAAIARHEIKMELAKELSQTKASLENRHIIDQAKRHLIREGLSEGEAYNTLRKLAMDLGIPMAEAARKIMHR